MRVTLLTVAVLHLIDLAFFHGSITAELIKTAYRLSGATFVPPLYR